METRTYLVPGMTCAHCIRAVAAELEAVDGVEHVDVDLSTKRVTVKGARLDDARTIHAIDDAGYDAQQVGA